MFTLSALIVQDKMISIRYNNIKTGAYLLFLDSFFAEDSILIVET